MKEKQQNTYCVYKHINKINGKVYIGQTKYGDDPNKRWLNGRGYRDSTHYGNAINKYGWENFDHIILYENLSLEEANYYEKLEISKYNSMDPKFGYNQTEGGENAGFSETLRQKLIEIKNQPAYRENQRNKKLGKKLFPNGRIISDETKQKQSDINKGKKSMYKNGVYTFVMADEIDNYLKDGWEFKGTPHSPKSEEAKLKESESLKKRFKEIPRSKESNIKTSKTLKEKYAKDTNKYYYINNGSKCIKIKEEELNFYLINGWIIGKIVKKDRKPSSPETGANISKSLKARYKNCPVPEERKEKLSKSLQETYKNMPKRTVMNDGIQNKYIPLTEVSDYESQGWKLGWLRKNNNNNNNNNNERQ